MSYRTAQPTAQKASLRDARYRPTPWTRKVRRAWPESSLLERRVFVGLLLFLSVSEVALGVYFRSPLAVAIVVVGVVAPVTWGFLTSVTREGLSVITARAALPRERRSVGKYASACGTCGSTGCPEGKRRISWVDRQNAQEPSQAVR